MSDPNFSPPRIHGLDGLRFVCALLVVFQHLGGIPLLAGVSYDHPAGRLVHWFYDIFAGGFAAVIVFFVISGFCIHFPYREGQSVLSGQFWLRRYIRVLPPLLVAILFGYLAGADMSLFSFTVTWSVMAELIYYALYPFLLGLSKRWGWNRLLVASLLLSVSVIAFYPRDSFYAVFGPWLNWVVGLPCWLLGCKLAHDWNRQRRIPSLGAIWIWRIAVFAACWLSNALLVHFQIGLPLSLNLFAFLVFFWLREEIAYYQNHPESRILVWAGGWSYSLYLTHVPANAFLKKWIFLTAEPHWIHWILLLVLILSGAWIFSLLFEYPSHVLARRIRPSTGKLRPPILDAP